MGYYQVAQICLNGHCTCDSVNANPEMSQKFCKKCGAETITSCPTCSAKIRGDYQVPGVAVFGSAYHVPSYCYNCGSPYPWIKSAIDAAEELISEDENLSEIEKSKLSASLPDIISETPKTQLSSIRIKKALISAGKFTAEGIRQFAIDFGCELALKTIGISK